MRKEEEYITRSQHDYDKLSLLSDGQKNCNAIYCLDVRGPEDTLCPGFES